LAARPSPDTRVVSDDLPREYEQWLNEDVRWIMTPEERAVGNNQDRDRFIEEFWQRRDPTPDTVENEFKEEHYGRIAYANMHFGWQKVHGWETDRGRIYIFFGPPDSIEVEPVVVNGTSAKKTEIWHFESVRNGQELNLRFVDFCACGDYRLLGKPAY
jgi:GWxTD domain-containing protein